MNRFAVLGMVAMLGLAAGCTTAEPEPTEMPTVAASEPSEAPQPTEAESSPAEGSHTFQIDPGSSEARFVIDEILGGNDNTVVGVSNQVQGEVSVDFGDPAGSRIGPIEIDAGSFVTDSRLRDEAIRNFILNAGSFGVISFTPTAVSGMPASVSVGDAGSVQVEGDLTIRDVTVPVTFTAELTLESESRISGFATATISRSDFNLTIPDVPRVAGVDDEFTLEFEFVALAP